jgi:asparagine synthase (glutamine-hydrolysing)
MAGVARNVPEPLLAGVAKAARVLDLDSRLQDVNRHRMLRLADLLTKQTVDGGYVQMMTHWMDAHDLVVGARDVATLYDSADYASRDGDFPSLLGELDLQAYLPNDILTKVDRSAMALSLETRVPLLDHRVVEFALSIPLSLKWRAGQTKWLLRQVLYRHVPPKLIDRPKMGFGVPIGQWLRGSLREWAEDLLAPSRLLREGFFNPAPIAAKWQEHLAGTRDWQYPLWDVLMFQAWLASHSPGRG